MKKTFKQIRQFNVAAENFTRRKPENGESKLGYAIKRVIEREVTPIVKDYQNDYQESYFNNVQKVHVDLALTDKATGALLQASKTSTRPYMYDKEGELGVINAERKFTKIAEKLLEDWDAKEFEIEPYITTELPPEPLSASELEAFDGFVIEPSVKE